MNVLTYPHSGTHSGGYIALLLMVVIVAGLYAMFRPAAATGSRDVGCGFG